MSRFLYLIFGVAAGLAVGLFAGWLLFGPPKASPTAALAVSPRSIEPTPVTGAGSASEGRADAGGRIVFRARPTEPPRPSPEPMAPAEEVERLQQRIKGLEKRLAIDDALAQEKQGVPARPPDHLDARFDQERVRQTVNAALKELHVEGEVSAVDCTEYPCLAVGEIKGGNTERDESRHLSTTAAFSGYHGDSKESFGRLIEDNGGHPRKLFGVAVYPAAATDAEQKAIAKRLRYRFDEIQGIE